jgi:hypothetical protein
MTNKSRMFIGEVAAFIVAMLLLVTVSAHGQQTIMNVPSADVTDKGHVYFRADSFYQPSPAAYNLNGNLALGLGHNFEIDLNGMNLAHPGQQSSIMPGFKWDAYKGKSVTLYIGDQFTQTLTHKQYAQGNFVYAAAAYTKGNLRLTGGAWDSQNSFAPGNRNGALAGVEYTAKTFKNGGSLVPTYDFESGNGLNGYSSFGVMVYPVKRLMILPAYNVGNSNATKGNHFAAVFIGWMF